MPTIGDLQAEFFDVQDGYRESYSQNGVTVQRPIIAKWSDRWIVALGFVGDAQLVFNPTVGNPPQVLNGTYLSRKLPDFNPAVQAGGQFRGGPGVYAIACDWANSAGIIENDNNSYPIIKDGTNKGNDGMIYGVTTYAGLPYDVVNDSVAWASSEGELTRYVERTAVHSLRNLRYPAGTFRFALTFPPGPPGIQDLVGEDLFKTLPTRTHCYKWMGVPSDSNGRFPPILDAAIQQCAGKLNGAIFDKVNNLNGRFQTNQLLCLTPQIEPTWLASGRRAFNISYLFEECPAEAGVWGWNAFFKPSTGQYSLVVNTQTGSPVFATADFYSLFRLS